MLYVHLYQLFMAVYLGADVINAIVNAVPQFVLDGITLGANLVAFFGFAMLLSVMINKKMQFSSSLDLLLQPIQD